MEKERFYVADGEMEKTCSSCGDTKPLDQFYKTSDGLRRRGACKECCNKVSVRWLKENRDRARSIQKKCRQKYPEKQRERSAIKRRNNPEACACRDMLKRILSLTGKKKMTKTEGMLGYSFNELREHITSQFEDGMTWGNRSAWHIDHIKPVNVFISEGETRPHVINALSNLRPLWAEDNLKRSRRARDDYRTD